MKVFTPDRFVICVVDFERGDVLADKTHAKSNLRGRWPANPDVSWSIFPEKKGKNIYPGSVQMSEFQFTRVPRFFSKSDVLSKMIYGNNKALLVPSSSFISEQQ